MANKELMIRIAADSKQAVAALGKIDQASQKTAGVMGKLDGAVKGALAGFGAQAVLDFAGDTLRAASDLQESTNAIKVTFGDAADEVLAFGESAAESAGLAASEFNNLVVPIGAALQNVGLSADEAAQKSIELTQRAADMASVFNVDVSEALQAVQAGLRGEADPLERFGVGLSAAAVEAYALEQGLISTASEMTDNIKVTARLGLLMQQTERVAGDFANTSDGLANTQRSAAAEAENLKAKIGEELQPAVLVALDAFRELAPILADNVGEVASLVGELGPLVRFLSDVGIFANGATDSLSAMEDQTFASHVASKTYIGALIRLKELFYDYREAVDQAEERQAALEATTKSSGKATDDYRDAAERMRDRLGMVKDAVTIVEQETEGYTRTIRDLITAQAEAADPALALINANIRLSEAQDEVNEATAEYGADSDEARDAQLALLSAVGDVDGALGNFRQNGGAESIEALRLMAERAGLSEDAITRLIDEIKQLNGTPIKGITKNGDGTYRVGNLNAFDTGGVVPGPRGAAQLAIVHGGETILPTHKGPVSLGSMGGVGVSSGMQQVVIQIDGQTLMTALAPIAQRYTNRTGRTVIG